MELSAVLIIAIGCVGFVMGYLAAVLRHGNTKVGTPSASHNTQRNAILLAKKFHKHYEEMAPNFGYSTRKESAVPWDCVPENNRKLMIAVCEKIITQNSIHL